MAIQDIEAAGDAPALQGEEHSCWYQATSLSERLALWGDRLPSLPLAPCQQEGARQRLAHWKNQPPFSASPHSFAWRLESAGLTEERLLALLALSGAQIQSAHAQAPTWLRDIVDAFTDPVHHERFKPIAHKIERSAQLVFMRALKPWLEKAFGRLHSGIQELQTRSAHLPFDPETIGSLCFARLLWLLEIQITRVMVLELHVAHLQADGPAETSAQRFVRFFQQLAQPAQILALFAEYPVLARRVSDITGCWLTSELELLERLCNDWDEIRQTFSPAHDPGVLLQMREGEGDTHHGGRSVSILTWSSGLRLVYKPRALAIDVRYQELLDWLNAHGCQPRLHGPGLLEKGTYGWCAYIGAATCNSPAEIERFYQRLGGHLALLYILEATDLHAQNLIAAGENPMLIDLEALLHPRFPSEDPSPDLAECMLDHSVLRTGLLPQRIFSTREHGGVDLSGLSAGQGQVLPGPVAQLQAGGTDQMRIARTFVALEQGNHRPTLHNEEVDVLAYSTSLVAGFTTVYRLLLRHRDELLSRLLPRFAQVEVRVLPRATRLYASLLVDSTHPDVLRDALELERLLDRLWIAVERQPYLAHLIPAERGDLERGDIPRFTAHPASRDLLTSCGSALNAFFPETSLQLARTRIQQLSEANLERQTWIIEASFASLSLDTHPVGEPTLQLCPTARPVTRQNLLDEARAIGDRLLKRALVHNGRVSWPGVSETNAREWRLLPAGPDLSNGLPGIALFLAYLGHLSGGRHYTRLARLIWQTIDARFCCQQRYLHWGSIGAFEGIGSFIYLLSHLGVLWHDRALWQRAEEIAGNLSELIAGDRIFDIVGGTAGCLAAVLSLHAVMPRTCLREIALHCGDHLLAHARRMPQGISWRTRTSEMPPGGMAHGNAGIALNLLRLAAVSQQTRFHQAALAAMDYERSLFLPEQNNRADLHTRPSMVAWCHGAAGIGLARLGSLRYHDDKATREEIKAAIQATRTRGFGSSHALCHGDMGNLETLLVASHLWPAQYPGQELARLQAALLQSMQTRGWRSCVPQGVETPGLMYGLAGTGYALLRLAWPQRMPSLLLLAPPASADTLSEQVPD
ncbi:MAG TPA: type 2 lanthipeptide synthetase LanM family protein [Ktedonobacteraceae bacterium]